MAKRIFKEVIKIYKVLAIFGKSGSGKDTIQKLLQDYADFHQIISYTTRPPRENEKQDIDYHFVTNETFYNLIYDRTLVEASEFREWWYGTSSADFDPYKINVGVFNPEGVQTLLTESKTLKVLPLYIHCNDKTRLIRILNRENNPDIAEMLRRYETDRVDFADIDFDYKVINNDDELIMSGTDLVKMIFAHCNNFFV